MESLLIEPKTKSELQFISEFLKRMHIKTKTLSTEDKEDLGMSKLMKQADRKQKVTKQQVLSKLGRK